MTLEQVRYQALVVSPSERFMQEISSLLRERNFHTDHVTNAGEARRVLTEKTYDFVIVNAPLSDEFGSRLCIDVTEHIGTLAVIFAPSDVYEDIIQRTVSYGVFVIRKPTSQQTILQAVSLLISAREMLRSVEKKAGKAEDKLQEIRIVNKAKWFLIDNEDMSEIDAHRYIEQQAMNMRIPKRTAAEVIAKPVRAVAISTLFRDCNLARPRKETI